jgi:hypothetical protein
MNGSRIVVGEEEEEDVVVVPVCDFVFVIISMQI